MVSWLFRCVRIAKQIQTVKNYTVSMSPALPKAPPVIAKQLMNYWQLSHSGSVRALAKELGVTTATLYNWSRYGIPLQKAKRIERITGGVFSVKAMFPNLKMTPDPKEKYVKT